MSDWIKENKFAAGLLLLAFLAIVGTYLFSGSKSEAFDAAKEEFDTNLINYENLAKTEPFPSSANLEARRKELVAYRGQVEGLQMELLKFRPKTFEKIRPAEFTTRLNEVGKALKKSYDEAGIKYPEKWQLGFETYTGSPPSDGATDFLNYQLDGLDWLFQSLAKAGPAELLNVYRPRLAVEDGKPMGVAAAPPANPGGRPGRFQRPNQPATGPTKPFFILPVEITFRGREASLRKFLAELANSKSHFVAVRSIRIQNTKAEIPPKKADAKFKTEAAPAVKDPFAGFDFVIPGEGGEEEAPPAEGETPPADGGLPPAEGDAPPADGEPAEPVVEPAPEINPEASGEQILGQVLGGEQLDVFLQLEFLLFRDNVALPEVK